MQSGEGSIIKVDRRQRIRRTAAQQAELLAEYQRSGVSAPEFARLSGVKYQTLCGWLRRSRSRPAIQWVEAVSAGASAGLKLQFPGGAWLEIADERQAALAAKLVQALARPC